MKTMKRFIAAVMAVTSVMALAPMSAFADTTDVTFDAPRISPAYTITIPATADLNAENPKATIKAENVYLDTTKHKQINVTLDSAQYVETGASTFIAKTEDGSSSVTYTIGKGDATTGVKVGDTVAEFTADGDQVLSFSEPTGATYAGTHTETLTFGISVESAVVATHATWNLTLSSPAKELCIIANGRVIAQQTLDAASTEFTVEMPELTSQTVDIFATDGSGNCWYCTQENMSFAIGQTYQISPTMTELGTESSADVYKMTGAGTIPADKTVVLSGVTISGGSITCSGNANIILLGSNSVTATTNEKAAIKIGGSGTTLTITGSGSLTAHGGQSAAGIGTDRNGTGGNIVINGGTVTATGGKFGAGIGTGRAQSGSSTCGDITINGGTVTATGGSNGGAGIGTGLSITSSGRNTCGAITIGTGVTMVTATKGSGAPNSIGNGQADFGGTQTCGTITIGGDATTYAAGVTTSPFTYPTAP